MPGVDGRLCSGEHDSDLDSMTLEIQTQKLCTEYWISTLVVSTNTFCCCCFFAVFNIKPFESNLFQSLTQINDTQKK